MSETGARGVGGNRERELRRLQQLLAVCRVGGRTAGAAALRRRAAVNAVSTARLDDLMTLEGMPLRTVVAAWLSFAGLAPEPPDAVGIMRTLATLWERTGDRVRDADALHAVITAAVRAELERGTDPEAA